METELKSQTSTSLQLMLAVGVLPLYNIKNKSSKRGKDSTEKELAFPNALAQQLRPVISSDALATQPCEICAPRKNTMPLHSEPLNFGLSNVCRSILKVS